MKEKDSEIELEGSERAPEKEAAVTKRRKPGQAKADKVSAEIEQYRARLAANEERLRTGLAVDGTPLTDIQRTNLSEVIARQRARLLELSS
jgi:tetrahydromethanopterin S-methyltransferase subunit F